MIDISTMFPLADMWKVENKNVYIDTKMNEYRNKRRKKNRAKRKSKKNNR